MVLLASPGIQDNYMASSDVLRSHEQIALLPEHLRDS